MRNNKFLNFLKQFTKTLFEQITLAILVGVAVEGAHIGAEYIMANNHEKQQLELIDLGVSKEYLKDRWGIPIIMIEKEEKFLNEEYFLFENNVVRVLYDEEKVVGYFITNTTGKNKYACEKLWENWILLKNTYSDITIRGDGIIEAGMAGPGKYRFYNEIYGQGSYLNYGSLYFSIYNYGYMEKKEDDLIIAACNLLREKEVTLREAVDKELIKEREEARTNTIGIVEQGYQDKVINPDENKHWLDIAQIIISKQ